MINERLSILACSDDRIRDRDSLIAWATQRWRFHEARGPLGVLPIRRTCAVESWRGIELDHYAGLYASDAATDVLDFALLEAYTCSIQQSIIRDPDPDLDWFYPDDISTGVNGFVKYLTENNSIYSGNSIRDRISAWQLPLDFEWLSQLSITEGFLFESDDEAHICAAAKEGFLTFLVING